MENNKNYFEANKLMWDARTEAHINSKFYDLEGFRNGNNALGPIVLEEMPEVDGKTLLHLQCHFGLDTLSFARMGAVVTGVDLSSRSIEIANSLSKELELPAIFIESNVMTMDQKIEEQFDIVFTSYGAICWLPDINAWAEQIAKRLKPGGIFYMAEFHPYLYMWEWKEHKIAYPYFSKGKVFHEKSEGSYTDGSEKLSYDEYFWIHGVADVQNALRNNGINVIGFNEYDYNPYPCFEGIQKRAEKEYIYEINGHAIPAVFTVMGVKHSKSETDH